ncbi:Fc.00g045700.m01.CDS01 [Cosmosporella sp. VM-42]
MPSAREGLLDRDWDEVKPDFSAEWTIDKEWKPYWKPSASVPKYKRAISWIKSLPWLQASPPSEKMRPTAWLDGLRGFAAFLVYWHHHELWAHEMSGQNGIFENGFGYEGKHHMVSFPVIRNFFSGGHYAVSTFFIISGYVLSIKPLKLVQAGEFVKLGDNLASALFRRWLRLFVPLVATMLLYVTAWHLFGIWVHGVTQQQTWWDEICAFYIEFKNFSFIYKQGGNPWFSYSFHLWSIPVEFKGSIVIYTSLMAFSRCSRTARLWCEMALIYYFMYITDGWYCSMFIAGMLLCDLDLLAKKGDLPRFLAQLEPAKEFIYYHLLVFSLFLGGVPCESRETDQLAKNRGWYYLSYLKPQAVFDYKWFYLFWAAVFLVSSVPRIRWLKRFFETRFCQYLGRISFALYMIHGPVLWTLGDRFYLATGWQTEEQLQHIPHWANKFKLPRSGPIGLEVSFLVPHILLLPITFFLADMVTRCIDTPSVKFASWLYKRTLGESPPKQAKA